VNDQDHDNYLGVVIDLHHYEEIMHDPGRHADRLIGLWQQVAARYRSLPRPVVYELLNEPTDKLTAETWNPILARTIAAIRAIDPHRLLIVEGANWASAKDLRDTLTLPAEDKNLIGSFHLYAPTYFTHQGAHWMPPRFGTLGVSYPGPPPTPVEPLQAATDHPESREFFSRYNAEPLETNPGGPVAIIAQLDMAKAFADRTGLQVYLGEFGAIVKADVASRARWTRLVRTEAEKRGFGWAYWDYCRNLAAYTSCNSNAQLIPQMKAALFD
jgi:endoglucanase